MLLNHEGCVITAPARGFKAIFGQDFQFNSTFDNTTCLRNSQSTNFSEVCAIL